MGDVERGDLAALATPQHRPARRILDRVAPDRLIQERDAHADHPIAAIALGERIAEYLVQRTDLLRTHRLRTIERPDVSPAARRGHQSPASASCGRTGEPSGGASSGASPPCSTTEAPDAGS